MNKPSLAALWSNFPDHGQYPTLKALYEHLGGNSDATGHIALFDGTNYREPVHDNYSTLFIPRTPPKPPVATYRGEFWEMRP